jgi:hypothetical protein
MSNNHRRMNEGRGSKKPALVIARDTLNATLGSQFDIRPTWSRDGAGSLVRLFTVYRREMDEHSHVRDYVVASGATIREAVTRAIKAGGR